MDFYNIDESFFFKARTLSLSLAKRTSATIYIQIRSMTFPPVFIFKEHCLKFLVRFKKAFFPTSSPPLLYPLSTRNWGGSTIDGSLIKFPNLHMMSTLYIINFTFSFDVLKPFHHDSVHASLETIKSTRTVELHEDEKSNGIKAGVNLFIIPLHNLITMNMK